MCLPETMPRLNEMYKGIGEKEGGQCTLYRGQTQRLHSTVTVDLLYPPNN